MGNSNTLVSAPVSDIRSEVKESLKTLEKTIYTAENDFFILESKVKSWERRIKRAADVLPRVTEEGREATENLLKQAQEIHAAYEVKFSEAESTLANLRSHHNELKKASDHFKIVDRQAELQQRISGINSIASVATIGDEKSESYDVRELQRSIHTIQALIELQGGKS